MECVASGRVTTPPRLGSNPSPRPFGRMRSSYNMNSVTLRAQVGIGKGASVMVTTSPEALHESATGLFRQQKLPKEFEFIERLSPLHQRLFFIDLWQTTTRYQIMRSEDALRDLVTLIEGWEATADIDADPDLAACLRSEKSYQPLQLA